MGTTDSRSLISIACCLKIFPGFLRFCTKSYRSEVPFSICSFLSAKNQASYLLSKEKPLASSLKFLSCTSESPPQSHSQYNLHPQTSLSPFILPQWQCKRRLSLLPPPRGLTLSIIPSPIFKPLFPMVTSKLKSLSSYLKKKNTPSSTHIFFWLLSSLAKVLERVVYTVFTSIHLAHSHKIPLTLLLPRSSATFCSWDTILRRHLCRRTLLTIHSYLLDFHNTIPFGLLPLSIHNVLPYVLPTAL